MRTLITYFIYKSTRKIAAVQSNKKECYFSDSTKSLTLERILAHELILTIGKQIKSRTFRLEFEVVN